MSAKDLWSNIDGQLRPKGNAPNETPSFQRHPSSGAPYVNHPTALRKDGKSRRVQYGRPSSAFKQIENALGLQKWAERMAVIGAVKMLTDGELLADDLALLLNYDPDDKEQRKAVDSVVASAKDTAGANLASARGTQRHLLTEEFDRDEDPVKTILEGRALGLSDQVSVATIAAWDALIGHYDLEILDVELPVVDDKYRLAGTLDRIARLRKDITLPFDGGLVTIPAGTVIVLDLKTGQLRVDSRGRVQFWHGYSPQIASYARSRRYDIGANGEERRVRWHRKPSQDHALIVHLTADENFAEARLVYVSLAAGREALQLAKSAKDFERRTDVIGEALGDAPIVIEVK